MQSLFSFCLFLVNGVTTVCDMCTESTRIGTRNLIQIRRNEIQGRRPRSSRWPEKMPSSARIAEFLDEEPEEEALEISSASSLEYMCYLRQTARMKFQGKVPALHEDLFSRCAVVSNSGALLGRGFGQEIDNHTAVFRFNDAPTEGYEADVGAKDTIRITGAKAFKRSGMKVKNGTLYFWLSPEEPPETMVEGASKDHVFRLRGSRRSLSRATMSLFTTRWWDMDMVGNLSKSFDPTTGALGMMIALNLCDTVDTYDMILSDASGSSQYRYYGESNRNAAQDTWHRTHSAEKELWSRLSDTPFDIKKQTGKATLMGFNTVDCDAHPSRPGKIAPPVG